MAGLFMHTSLCVCTGRFNDTIVTDGWDGYVNGREQVTHMRAHAHSLTRSLTHSLTHSRIMRQADPQCISFPKAASGLETNCMTQSMTQSVSLVFLLVGSLAPFCTCNNDIEYDNVAWADLPCVANQRLNKVCLDAASSNLQKQRQPCGVGGGLSQCLGLQCD